MSTRLSGAWRVLIGGIIKYQPTSARAATWRMFMLSTSRVASRRSRLTAALVRASAVAWPGSIDIELADRRATDNFPRAARSLSYPSERMTLAIA